MRHDSLAHYLAAVGVVSLCEIGSRWSGARCEFGAPLEEIAASIEAAMARKKLLPTTPEPEHPLWCNRARRSLSRGVADAREWLAEMEPEQRAAELTALLTGDPLPQKLDLPTKQKGGKRGPRPKGEEQREGGNPNWNLGTLMPALIGDPPAARVSAWLPVLAWEAQRLILTRELRADGCVGALEGDVYSWLALQWAEPLTVAEVFLLLNGGPQRWHYAGRVLPCIRTAYHLRDTAGGGKTLEFCRGDSWAGEIGQEAPQ